MAQAIPMIVMAVGTAVSSYGMVRQGQAAKKEANAQAELIRNNALQDSYDAGFNESVARAAEKENLMQAAAQKRILDRKARLVDAEAVAKLQRQGLMMGSVSFEDVLSATAIDSQLETNNLVYSAAVKGQEIRSQGLGFQRKGARAFAIGQFESRATQMAGRNKASAMNWSAAGNFVSGMGSAAAAGQQGGVKWLGGR